MVAPHYAVTAAHCLGVRRLGHVAPPGAVHLLLGYADGMFVRHMVADAIDVAPDAAGDPEAHRGRDIALLHFAEPVAATLRVDPAPLPAGALLTLGGYGQDRAERLAVDPHCSALGYDVDPDGAPLLHHDCSGTRGSSGGAVLTEAGGTWRLAGVQVAGRREGAGGWAVPGALVARMLARAMERTR